MRGDRITLCVCLTCGTTFEANNYRIKHGGGRYCSKECRGKGMSNQVTLTCKTCGTSFERKQSAIRGENPYCSNPCRYAKRARPIVLNEDGLTARIPLFYHDDTVQAYAIIDAADAEWAGQWGWHLSPTGYVIRGQSVLLHRELLGLTTGDGVFGDHINLNKLDNRRENLRPATPSESPQNVSARPGTSTHRGVSWAKDRGVWVANVNVNRKRHHLGSFASEDEAAEAAREARAKLMPFSTN